MLLGTSSDQAPTSQRLAEIDNRLSGEKIAPTGSPTPPRAATSHCVVSASLDAYQTFSDDTLRAISDWYDDSAGVPDGRPGSSSLLRPASWVLGIGELLLLLSALPPSEELLDVGYSLLPLEVTAPARYSLFKALSWLPALVLLVLPALALLLLPLPGLTSIPALFCGYFGCLGLVSLLLTRCGRCQGSPVQPFPHKTQPSAITHLGLGRSDCCTAPGVDAPSERPLHPALFRRKAAGLSAVRHRCRPGHRRLALRRHAAGPVQWLPMRLCLGDFSLPYAALGFLSIPAYGFTGVLYGDPAGRCPNPRCCLHSCFA